MFNTLYTAEAGYDRSAIMRQAWADFRSANARKPGCTSFSWCLKGAWREARKQRAQLATNAWIKANAAAAKNLAEKVAWARAA